MKRMNEADTQQQVGKIDFEVNADLAEGDQYGFGGGRGSVEQAEKIPVPETSDIVDIHELKDDEGGLGRVLQTVSIKDVEQIALGADRLKYKVRASFLGEELQTSFVVRKKGKEYFRLWATLKKAGLPVIDTLRVTKANFGAQSEDSDAGGITVIQPNLTADGSKLYGKEFIFESMQAKHKSSNLEETDRHLITILENKKDQLLQEMLHFADLATQNNIFLPLDEFFELHVFPDGTYEVILLDFDWAVVAPNVSHEKLDEHNTQFVSVFLERLVDSIPKQDQEEDLLEPARKTLTEENDRGDNQPKNPKENSEPDWLREVRKEHEEAVQQPPAPDKKALYQKARKDLLEKVQQLREAKDGGQTITPDMVRRAIADVLKNNSELAKIISENSREPGLEKTFLDLLELQGIDLEYFLNQRLSSSRKKSSTDLPQLTQEIADRRYKEVIRSLGQDANKDYVDLVNIEKLVERYGYNHPLIQELLAKLDRAGVSTKGVRTKAREHEEIVASRSKSRPVSSKSDLRTIAQQWRDKKAASRAENMQRAENLVQSALAGDYRQLDELIEEKGYESKVVQEVVAALGGLGIRQQSLSEEAHQQRMDLNRKEQEFEEQRQAEIAEEAAHPVRAAIGNFWNKYMVPPARASRPGEPSWLVPKGPKQRLTAGTPNPYTVQKTAYAQREAAVNRGQPGSEERVDKKPENDNQYDSGSSGLLYDPDTGQWFEQMYDQSGNPMGYGVRDSNGNWTPYDHFHPQYTGGDSGEADNADQPGQQVPRQSFLSRLWNGTPEQQAALEAEREEIEERNAAVSAAYQKAVEAGGLLAANGYVPVSEQDIAAQHAANIAKFDRFANEQREQSQRELERLAETRNANLAALEAERKEIEERNAQAAADEAYRELLEKYGWRAVLSSAKTIGEYEAGLSKQQNPSSNDSDTEYDPLSDLLWGNKGSQVEPSAVGQPSGEPESEKTESSRFSDWFWGNTGSQETEGSTPESEPQQGADQSRPKEAGASNIEKGDTQKTSPLKQALEAILLGSVLSAAHMLQQALENARQSGGESPTSQPDFSHFSPDVIEKATQRVRQELQQKMATPEQIAELDRIAREVVTQARRAGTLHESIKGDGEQTLKVGEGRDFASDVERITRGKSRFDKQGRIVLTEKEARELQERMREVAREARTNLSPRQEDAQREKAVRENRERLDKDKQTGFALRDLLRRNSEAEEAGEPDENQPPAKEADRLTPKTEPERVVVPSKPNTPPAKEALLTQEKPTQLSEPTLASVLPAPVQLSTSGPTSPSASSERPQA